MIKDIKDAIASAVPVLIWGPPGVGKTAAVLTLGRRLGLPVEVVIASIREPTDFAGLPVVHDGEVRFAPPNWARRLAAAGKGILFLDEVSTAPPAVQAALLRVVLDRVVGDLPLPPGVAIVAAANPPELAAGGWELSPPLANRFVHLQWRLDAGEWAENFPNYWGDPPAVPGLDPAVWARARAMVAGFIRSRPHLLLQLPKGTEAQGRAWPSPRSWDAASRALAAVLQRGGQVEDAAALVAGAVGEGPGLEFIAWARELDLPDPEALLRNPASFKLPRRGDQAYAVLAAVAAAAASRLDQDRWLAGWQVLARAAEQGAKDIAAAAARTLARARRAGWPAPGEAAVFLPLLKEAGLL